MKRKEKVEFSLINFPPASLDSIAQTLTSLMVMIPLTLSLIHNLTSHSLSLSLTHTTSIYTHFLSHTHTRILFSRICYFYRIFLLLSLKYFFGKIDQFESVSDSKRGQDLRDTFIHMEYRKVRRMTSGKYREVGTYLTLFFTHNPSVPRHTLNTYSLTEYLTRHLSPHLLLISSLSFSLPLTPSLSLILLHFL